MKIVFIGCVEFSYAALELTLSLKDAEVVGVVTRKESKFNNDFRSLAPLAEKAGIPCLFSDTVEPSEMAHWIKNLKPDVIYCFGWSYLLGRDIMDISSLGVVGFHPAALPRNRGRHPIVWALALGLTETAATFFFVDEGIDSGDILDQRGISIEPSDDAASLYSKIVKTGLEQIRQFTPKLALNGYSRMPQDGSQANYWRKRARLDGLIDWRMSSKAIYNLVRALAKPYVGAHCNFHGDEIKIWKAEECMEAPSNAEPGKILKASNGFIVVKCGDGALKILKHEFVAPPREGDYFS